MTTPDTIVGMDYAELVERLKAFDETKIGGHGEYIGASLAAMSEAATAIATLIGERDLLKAVVDRQAAQLAKTFGIEKLGWLDHWKARATAAEAENAKLREALGPFAKVAEIDELRPMANSFHVLLWKATKKVVVDLTLGDFRRARTALDPKQGEGE